MNLGAREREDEERQLTRGAQRGLDEANRRQISPVQVLEHEDERVMLAFCNDQRLERATKLVAHQDGVRARGEELRARRRRDRNADDLADELRELLSLGSSASLDERRKPNRLRRDGVALARAHRAPERAAHERERGARAQRVAARGPDVDVGSRLAQPPEELVPDARLADSRLADDEDRARRRLVRALVEERDERGELAIAPHARRRLAEERALTLRGLARPDQRGHAVDDAHVEAIVEETARDLVEQRAAAHGARRELRCTNR